METVEFGSNLMTTLQLMEATGISFQSELSRLMNRGIIEPVCKIKGRNMFDQTAVKAIEDYKSPNRRVLLRQTSIETLKSLVAALTLKVEKLEGKLNTLLED